MCIKKSSYITETYIQYNVQREKQVKKYIWVLYHELVPFLQSRNCFRYVPENEIEGGILGWTPSAGTYFNWGVRSWLIWYVRVGCDVFIYWKGMILNGSWLCGGGDLGLPSLPLYELIFEWTSNWRVGKNRVI